MDSKTTNNINSIFKSALVFKTIEGYKYAVKISHGNTTAVNVMKILEPGAAASNWLLRFDNPHKGALFPHINIRHKFTGFADPHLPLPPGGLTLAKGGAYTAKLLDWICYTALVIDGYQLTKAIYKDHQDGTTHNTTKCATEITGQYVGAVVGGAVGKTIGSFLIPGIGPLVGGISLAVLGVAYGKELVPTTASYIYNYWTGEKSEKEKQRELMRYLFFSRLHANPILTNKRMLRSKL